MRLSASASASLLSACANHQQCQSRRCGNGLQIKEQRAVPDCVRLIIEIRERLEELDANRSTVNADRILTKEPQRNDSTAAQGNIVIGEQTINVLPGPSEQEELPPPSQPHVEIPGTGVMPASYTEGATTEQQHEASQLRTTTIMVPPTLRHRMMNSRDRDARAKNPHVKDESAAQYRAMEEQRQSNVRRQTYQQSAQQVADELLMAARAQQQANLVP